MSDGVTKEERARQVGESLRAWCKAQGVRMLVGVNGNVQVFSDRMDRSERLFEFGQVGYGGHYDDEILT